MSGPLFGWKFKETMTGSWTRSNGKTEDFPLAFTLTAAGDGLLPTIFKADGAIRAEGLASDRSLCGTLNVSPVIMKFIHYDLDFIGDNGRRYSLVGQKDIDFGHPYLTATRLPFRIKDDQGATLGRGRAVIEGVDLRKFLRSFRPFLIR